MSKVRSLGIKNKVEEIKKVVEEKSSYSEDLAGMKIVMVERKLLVEYEDNEKVFGNLEGQEFEDLIKSIAERGILQPLIIRPMEDKYEILAGHQRNRGAGANKINKVPCIIKDVDDIEARKIWLETNIRSRHLSREKLSEALVEYAKVVDIERDNGEIQGRTSEILAEKFDMKPRTVEEMLMFAKKLTQGIRSLDLPKTSMSKLAKLEKEEQDALLLLLGEDTIKDLTTVEVEKMVSTVKEQAKNLDSTYKKALDETQKELNEKEKELQKINMTFGDMRKALGELTQKNAGIERQIELERLEKEALEQKLKEATEGDKAVLKAQIVEKENELRNLAEKSNQFIEEVKKLQGKITEIQDQKDLIERDHKNLESDYKSLYEENKKRIAENEELKKKLEEAKKNSTDYEQIKAELEELKKKDRLQMQLSTALQEVAKAHTFLNELSNTKLNQKEHIDLKDKITEYVNEIDHLLKKL